VRWIAAVAAAALAGGFAMAYDAALVAVVLPCNFDANRLSLLPALTRFACHADVWFFLVPGAALVAGAKLRERRPVAFEITVSLTWLLALTWILFVLLAWTLPLLPMCSPIREG